MQANGSFHSLFQALSPGLRRLIYLIAFVAFFAYLGTLTANHSGKIALILFVAATALFYLCVPRARWLVIVSPAVAAFFLMNRFDEGFALVAGGVTLKFNYWYAAVILAGLFLGSVVNRRVGLHSSAAPNPFTAWYGFFLGLFAVMGVLSIAFNAAFDDSLRHAPLTELFALGLVVVPALFPLAISASGISREDTLRCMVFSRTYLPRRLVGAKSLAAAAVWCAARCRSATRTRPRGSFCSCCR
jgi:hypothetical protein